MTAHVANCLRRCTLHLPHPAPFHVRQATTRSPRRPPLSHVWAALLILYIGSTITKQGVTQRHIAKTEQGKTVTGTGYVRCHAGMATLLCRHGNVVTPAWQRCYAGMATLLRRRGNVVTAAWQRCYGPVATLLWARGNVVMGPWQPTKRHLVTEMPVCVMDLCL